VSRVIAEPVPADTIDAFALGPIAPSPDGSLTAAVRCRTARTGGPVTTHKVTISADWSVQTPHDIELERIATAMGGFLSCVDLVDREVPALRELVQLRARRVLPQILRNVAGRWSLRTLAPDCRCAPFVFGSAVEAAEHARDPYHVARLHDVVPRRLEGLLRVVEDAYGTSFYTPPRDMGDAVRAVRERDGLGQLWDAGVHPQLVARLHERLWPGGPPMPVWFYLGATSRQPNLIWLAATLAAVPDEDVAVWACWTEAELDRTHPAARAAWLLSGVPRKAIIGLVNGAYTPADVAQLASLSGRSIPSAACALAAWHRAACRPSPQDIVTLDELDVSRWYEPSIGAVDWLCERVGHAAGGPSRTAVGLMLAVCGTRCAAMDLLSKGICDLRVAARMMRGEPMIELHAATVSSR
jgi:hypothetical protein